jgi:hypothetical protein
MNAMELFFILIYFIIYIRKAIYNFEITVYLKKL